MKNLKFLLPYIIIYSILFLLPVSLIVYYSLGSNDVSHIYFFDVIKSNLIREVFFNTLLYSIIATFITSLLGWILGFTMVFGSSRIKTFTSFIGILPLLVNPLVIIYGWMLVLSNGGWVNNIVKAIFGNTAGLQMLYTPQAVIIGMVYLGIPYMTLSIALSMLEIKTTILSAAKTMGASFIQIITKIILPISKEGIYTGIFFVFVISVGYYIIPSLLGGGKVDFISTLIEQNVNKVLNWPLASAISIWMLVSMILMFLIVKNILIKVFR